MFVPVPSQDMNFQCHMSWSFLCLVIWGERWLLVLLILVEFVGHHFLFINWYDIFFIATGNGLYFCVFFHELIKQLLSIILTGFKSQWIILSRCNNFRHCRSEKANLLIKAILKPWKLFFLISSYKFILKKKQTKKTFLIIYLLKIMSSIKINKKSGQFTSRRVDKNISFFFHIVFLYAL